MASCFVTICIREYCFSYEVLESLRIYVWWDTTLPALIQLFEFILDGLLEIETSEGIYYANHVGFSSVIEVYSVKYVRFQLCTLFKFCDHFRLCKDLTQQ